MFTFFLSHSQVQNIFHNHLNQMLLSLNHSRKHFTQKKITTLYNHDDSIKYQAEVKFFFHIIVQWLFVLTLVCQCHDLILFMIRIVFYLSSSNVNYESFLHSILKRKTRCCFVCNLMLLPSGGVIICVDLLLDEKWSVCKDELSSIY